MGELAPVAAAIAVTALGAIGTWFSARRLRRLGVGADNATVLATRRELADVWEEKYKIVIAERDDLKAKLAFAEASGDECRRELDDLRSERRTAERERRAYGTGRRPRG